MTTHPTNQQTKARELLAKIRAKQQQREADQLASEQLTEQSELKQQQQSASQPMEQTAIATAIQQTLPPEQPIKLAMEWNAAQREFINLGSDIASSKRMILTGPAGTGKTTAMKGLIQTYQVQAKLGGFPLLSSSSKHLTAGTLGIAMVSFTNKAVSNIRKVMPDELKSHCLTIHKLIEFEPVFYEVWDAEAKKMRKTMRFEPQRHAGRKLPSGLAVVIIDEASMVATADRERDSETGQIKPIALFEMLEDALPAGTKIIFSGDIQQLPPVFGDSILGHSLLKVPTVELTEVYRQALESPIILNAHRILKGHSGYFNQRTEKDPSNPKRTIVPAFDKINKESNGKLTITHWQKKLSPEHAVIAITAAFKQKVEQGTYLPDEDIILCPFNVGFGGIEINKSIAQFLGTMREAVVTEIIAGMNKQYFAVGDKVMWQKEEYKITEIVNNAQYLGKRPQEPSALLDRWGCLQTAKQSSLHTVAGEEHANNGSGNNIQTFLDSDLDALLESMASDKNGEDRFNQASHIVHIQNIAAPEIEVSLSTAGELNALEFGYCITVHKSQGSEWQRVFILFHHTHAVMMYRELLYTALTRAREEVHIICEANSLEKCVKNPRIKGESLEDKAAFFTQRKENKAKMKEIEAKKQGELEIDD